MSCNILVQENFCIFLQNPEKTAGKVSNMGNLTVRATNVTKRDKGVEQMNQNLLSRVLEFLRRKMWSKRWQKAVTCLAAVVVFGVTYALILPAITMTGKYPVLSAETLTAWTGDELAVKVSAETAPEDGGKIIVLTLEGEGADLSQNYAFNEDGVCVIIDEAQNEIELHRAVREETKNTVDYWFAMEPGTETVFTLNLADEVDAARFAETMEAVKLSGEEMAAEAEKATASDAGKSAAVQTEKKETGKATPADAEKKVEVKKASASNADVAEANKIAENGEEKIKTEAREEGFTEILDGTVINDLEADEEEEEEQTEIVAELKVSAGVGDKYEDAVKDAAKNADKRGDAQLKLQWKDIVAKQAAAPELVSYLNGATIAVFYDENAGIPEDARLSVTEFDKDSDKYKEYLAQAKSAMEKATGSDASRTVTQARFFDITILDGNDNEVTPLTAVKVIITYEEAMKIEEDGDLNVVHFKDDDTQEILAPVKSEEKQEVDALSFTTDSFSVYGVVGTGTLTAQYFTVEGEAYEVTVTYNAASGIPEGSRLVVAEVMPEDKKYASYVDQTAEKIKSDKADINYIKLLDISIVDGNGTEVQPTVPVDVQIRLLDKNVGEGAEKAAGVTKVVHFGTETEVVESASEGNAVNFKAEGFSVYAVVTVNELSDLNGKSYGILNTKGGSSPTGSAMMYQASKTGLQGKNTTVRINTVDRVNAVYVANNIEITMWTLTKDNESDKFFFTTVVGNNTKYLQITSDGLSLADADKITDDCRITVEKAASGSYAGKYKLSNANGAISWNSKDSRFEKAAAAADGETVWMDFAERSTLNDDDFVVYTASKVSVSGTPTTTPSLTSVKLSDGTYMNYDVNNGEQVILYTRIWNEDTKKYDYYAVDYDGMLVKAYENGDTISWVGSKVNTMLWDFTEYYYDNNPEKGPNYYYELQNNSSKKYIAPQGAVEESTTNPVFLSDEIIGLNLNGRRYKEYYSTILAWDKKSFSYRTLKIDKDGRWKLVSAPMSQAADFYFAKMTTEETGSLSTVATLDHKPFGITLKMRDYGDVTPNESGNKKNRSREQYNVLGPTEYNQWKGSPGLLESHFDEKDEEGNLTYPDVKVKGEGGYCHNLSELYGDDAVEVNQSFLLSTYNETGYFEYDSTKNFAHLISHNDDIWIGQPKPGGEKYEIGDFVIYDQLGTTNENKTEKTLYHGQFFPYNDLAKAVNVGENGKLEITPRYSYSKTKTNERDIHAVPLSSLDPRNGEPLYEMPRNGVTGTGSYNGGDDNTDYFFGMEMSASFMQSAGGVDDWGHDLIFEFSGDDDFWLYVDGMLILDLGGIHSALDASVNFKTGQVLVGNSGDPQRPNPYTLRQLYIEGYKEDHGGEEPSDEWLNKIFKDGGSVFNDFSGHTMRMFYMERGAGASNLHMRFNLAPYVPGEVELEKEVKGSDNITTPFPYQIYYTDSLNKVMGLAGSTDFYPMPKVTYIDDTGNKVEVTPVDNYPVETLTGTLTYDHVILVNPGQTVKIQFPDENTYYSFVECGVDTRTFTEVRVNGTKLNRDQDLETPTGVEEIKDYRTDPKVENPDQDGIQRVKTVGQRKKVIFENHVSPDALETLKITKRLWEDAAMTREISAERDPTKFKFRIYIGRENNGTPKVYNSGLYYVKDPKGYICRYNGEEFEPFEHNGARITSVPDDLTEAELDKIEFKTSPNGAAEEMQAGFSIEIPGLIAGTTFVVEERNGEIPGGYNRIGYTYTDDKYTAPDPANPLVTEDSIKGTISSKWTDATVSVHNQNGYGLVLNKVWTDAEFMQKHDPVYFAVYVKDSNDPLDGSVRQLTDPSTSITWFFPQLESTADSINDYKVYEVKLLDENEKPVTGEDAITKYKSIQKVEQGETNQVGATEEGEHGDPKTYGYTVRYDWGMAADGANSKTDTVTNDRPGIKIVKKDMAGNPLEGAVFELSEIGDGVKVDPRTKTFTSGEDGLVAVAYLEPSKEYTLKEVATPAGYSALIKEFKIKVEVNDTGVYTVYVNGSDTPESGYYTIDQKTEPPTVDKMPTITIKNRPYTLQAKKIDSYNDKPMRGVHFALYEERFEYEGNYPMPFYVPMQGYEDLVTNEQGIIPGIVLPGQDPDHPGLPAGNYYLREKDTPPGYNPMKADIRISISATGEVTLKKAIKPTQSGHWNITDDGIDEIAEIEGPGEDNVLCIKIKNKPNDPVRILKNAAGTNNPLKDIDFELYKIDQVDITTMKPKAGQIPMVSGTTDEKGIFDLGGLEDNITYYLFETKTLPGYVPLLGPVIITTSRTAQNDFRLQVNYNGTTLTPEKVNVKMDDDVEWDVWQITVENSLGYELPSTGGPGTALYTFGGIAILVMSALMYGFRMRRGERRSA